MFRVIIAGGRDFKDYDLLVKTMNHLLSNVKDDITVVCGKARGADTLGEQYAKEYGYSVQHFPADWDRYGKAAGYLRNIKITPVPGGVGLLTRAILMRHILRAYEKFHIWRAV